MSHINNVQIPLPQPHNTQQVSLPGRTLPGLLPRVCLHIHIQQNARATEEEYQLSSMSIQHTQCNTLYIVQRASPLADWLPEES